MLINPIFFKSKKTPILLSLISIFCCYFFAYHLERTQAFLLISLYIALFVLFYFIVKYSKNSFRLLILLALIIRLVFLFAIPNLSQDFYRFIWDGYLVLDGINPYLSTPFSYIEAKAYVVPQAQTLYDGMGQLNASHYSNYPPLNQLFFALANLCPGSSILSSVIGLRLVIIAADFGTLYFGKRLLKALNLPVNRIWWYVLNPFIIIEFTGNLHFEGVLIFFLIWSLYLLQKSKYLWSAVLLGCSISVKLIPLMFLPLFINYFSKNDKFSFKTIAWKTLIGYYAVVIFIILLFFLPFYDQEFIINYSKSVGLWFGKFEFNASIYYLLRAIGYWFTGYNEIKIISKILPIVVMLFILYQSYKIRAYTIEKLIKSMLMVLSVYLFLSTTVHPWYISILVVLCLFTHYRFPLVWSFVIVLSYLSYLSIGNSEKSENLYLIALEYLIVFGALWFDFKKKTSKICSKIKPI